MSKAWSGGSSWAWRKTRAQVLLRDHYRCQMRTAVCTGEAKEVDHIVPKYLGGSDDLSNLRAVCSACHDTRSSEADPAPTPKTQW